MIEVYSLKASSWSTIQGFNSGYINGKLVVFANGALHWEECYRHRLSASWEIVTLDLAAERFEKIALPIYEDGCIYWTLGVSRGYLVACCNYDEPNRADLWVMKEYSIEKSWTKLVTISSPVDCRGYISPLFAEENGVEVLLKLGGEISLYNSRNGSFKRLHSYLSGDFLEFQVATYFESFASSHFE
ncbi:F-box/kelch-repeat protein At3g23880-like [Nicotiana sylvestris]|uniref:F-box/kelch-repeat protein At3g23880-like n=2 Tax=Nicotiana TaxID=4085 RepID=A0A1S3X084_TOBAC|nr:PREDICTED: F-box/kelch-repeat protein At3g23880-like [Nicotiana sylvestris]XP_016433307.1 PREDICTED: F-box/kelch-repeat protein At3g23880-like [Nicotiana tabacum]